VPCKTLGHLHGACFAEPLLVQRGREHLNAGPPIGHCDCPDHGAKHQPGGRLILARRRWPPHPPPADQPAVDLDGAGPADRNRLVGRRIGAKSVGERDHAGVEGAPRGAQELAWLEHHGEFGEIEPPDAHQRAGPALGCNAASVGKGVSALPQPDQREGRRQLDRFHQGNVAGWGRPQGRPPLSFSSR